MGKKKRILFNPKFAHLKKMRFGSNSEEEPKGDLENHKIIEEQEPIEETPVLKAVEKQIEAENRQQRPRTQDLERQLPRSEALLSHGRLFTFDRRTHVWLYQS